VEKILEEKNPLVAFENRCGGRGATAVKRQLFAGVRMQKAVKKETEDAVPL
jgi:hypothetical protein